MNRLTSRHFRPSLVQRLIATLALSHVLVLSGSGAAYAASAIGTNAAIIVGAPCTAPCVYPASSYPGATVLLYGSFPASQPTGAVVNFAGFRGSAQSVVSWSASAVGVKVPTNLVPGRYELTVSWIDPRTRQRVGTATQPIWLQVLGTVLPLTLRENVRILDSATLQSLTPVSSSQLKQSQLTLTFYQSPLKTAQSSFKFGDVLIAGVSPSTPHGLLRKVTSVQQLSSSLLVGTVPATLRDAVVQGNLSGRTRINNDTIRQALVAQGAVLGGADPTTGCPNTFDLPVTGGVQIKGSICGDLDLEAQVYVDWSDAGASVAVAGSDLLHLQAVASGTIDKDIPVYTLPLGVTPVGPFVLTLQLIFTVGATGEVTGTMSFGMVQTASVAAGASCDLSITSGLSCGAQLNGTNTVTSETPSFGDKADLKAYGRAKLVAQLDGVDIVDLSLEPSIHAWDDRWADPWWKTWAELLLTLNYDLAELMGIHDSTTHGDLLDITMPLGQAAGAAPGVVPTIVLSTTSTGLTTTATSTCVAELTPVGSVSKVVESCELIPLFISAKDSVTGHGLEASQVRLPGLGCTTDAYGKCTLEYVPPSPTIGSGSHTEVLIAQLPDATSNPVAVTVIAPSTVTCVDANGNPCP